MCPRSPTFAPALIPLTQVEAAFGDQGFHREHDRIGGRAVDAVPQVAVLVGDRSEALSLAQLHRHAAPAALSAWRHHRDFTHLAQRVGKLLDSR